MGCSAFKYRTEIKPTEPDTDNAVVGNSEDMTPEGNFPFNIHSEVFPDNKTGFRFLVYGFWLAEIQTFYGITISYRKFNMRTALTIAGSDPSGGAGIQADLKTFQAHGVFGMSVITAVTVQNTQKVYGVQEIDPRIVHDQILRLFEDIEINAVKIGMVSSILLIETIATALKEVKPPAIILDPVMISKSGYRLLNKDAQKALIRNLFPVAEVVTPNLYEAEALTDMKISDENEMKTAAEKILKLGAKKVVVKGGHLDGMYATDILYDGVLFKELTNRRVKTKNTHGTGCTFSSAIAANIAKGIDFFDAVTNAKAYITGAIEHSLEIGHGHGPVDHFFKYHKRTGK